LERTRQRESNTLKDKEKHRQFVKDWQKRNPEKVAKYHKIAYARKADYLRNRRQAIKSEVLDHYGRHCACCAEPEEKFLSIDHKNNDGYKERKGRGGSSDFIHRQIIKNNFPDTYQILCYNCNLGKARNKGICPHSLTLP